MATWRFVSEEEDAELRQRDSELSETSLEDLDGIVRVVGGLVSEYGSPESETLAIPSGWFACILDDAEIGPAYTAERVRVVMQGQEVELRKGTLLALIPPEHMEKVNEFRATRDRRATEAGGREDGRPPGGG